MTSKIDRARELAKQFSTDEILITVIEEVSPPSSGFDPASLLAMLFASEGEVRPSDVDEDVYVWTWTPPQHVEALP